MQEYSRTLFAHADRHRRTDTAAQVERLLEQSSAKDAQIAELKRRLSDMHAELRCGFLFRVGPRFDSRVLPFSRGRAKQHRICEACASQSELVRCASLDAGQR